MVKLAIFTGDLSFSVIRGIFEILDRIPEIEKVVIVEQKQTLSILKKIKRQKFNIKKNGWRWILHIFVTLLKSLAIRQNIQNKRRTGQKYTFDNLVRHPSVDYYAYSSLHSEACLGLIDGEKIDLGISIAAPILQSALFSLPRLGTINLHKGKLPHYKGMPAGFWEIHNDESEVGVTVHKIVEGLDAGDILLEDNIPIFDFSTANGLRVQLDELGIQMIAKAVSEIISGEAVFTSQGDKGRLYRKPTLKAFSQAHKKILKREGFNSRKEFAKKIIMGFYVLYRKTLKFFLTRERAKSVSILLFHRVSDEFRDSVTIGVEQFDSLIGFLAKNYHILTLDDILNSQPPITIKPHVVITFDDGYLDNYANAVPILLKHGISATFFISTDKITNNTAFDHDLEQLGTGLDNMNWDQVRKMKEWGFDIGSHTVTHPRLSLLDTSALKVELEESQKTIKEELDIEKVMFAYTHGGKKDFTLEARKIAEEIEYTCICSAYGGINSIPVNIWNIKRFGVNYAMKIPAVIARIEGWGNTENDPDWASFS